LFAKRIDDDTSRCISRRWVAAGSAVARAIAEAVSDRLIRVPLLNVLRNKLIPAPGDCRKVHE
jgi:hypothetical protein